MIQPQELMIGNWINTIHGNEQVIEIVCDSVNTTNGEGLFEIYGISLTPEILEKNLSEKLWRVGHGVYALSALLRVNFNNGTPYIFKVNSVGMTCDICEVAYVHSLQNAFYTISGQHLKIDL